MSSISVIVNLARRTHVIITQMLCDTKYNIDYMTENLVNVKPR